MKHAIQILLSLLMIGISSIALANTKEGTVYIIGTGGTIAGSANEKVSSQYTAGKLDTDQLLKALPDLNQLAKIQVIDLFHIDSADITTSDWLILARQVNELLKKDDVKSVVITHGTDTLEETAYFLDLVVKSKKPVVLVGSMRAATSISADGPINLYNAIAVAASSEAIGKGVLVVMDDQIFDARDVTKTNATRVDTFKSPNTGPVGSVNFGTVHFSKASIKNHTINTPFNVIKLSHLPRVEIINEYAGTEGRLLESAMNEQAIQGIVIAGSGDGNIAEPERALLKKARDKGIIIVRSSRTGSGYITYDYVHHLDTELGLIPADDLNPQKSRILLMLALTKTHDASVIQKYFSVY